MLLPTENVFTFNPSVLSEYIEKEVERLVALRFDAFKTDLSENYFFDDCLLSREEVAKKLDVSLGKLDDLRRRNKIKSCALGKGVKFRKSEVLKFIKLP